MNLATASLAQSSINAAQLWHQLESAESSEEIDQLLQSLWQTQETQELAVDAHADLADQIDAEIASITARMQYLIELHSKAINKLQGWKERLDRTVLYFNECGILTSETIGKHRRITVKENPPTCEVLIDPSQLPEPYRRVETKTVTSADKKAIANAWKQRMPVDGTKV
ncbi:MAG: siphovirus Gp157 family protein, partial [Microcoleus sp.]